MPGKEHSKDDWLCKFCRTAVGQPFKNFGHRVTCREFSISKGTCFRAKAGNGGSPSVSTKPTLAEKQVGMQNQDELRKKTALVADLQAKLKKKEKELQDAKGSGTRTVSSGERDESERAAAGGEAAEGTRDPEVAEKLAQVRSRIKFLESIPEDHRVLVGDCSAALGAKIAEAKALGEEMRNSRPLNVRLRQSQDHLRLCQGRQEKCSAALASRQAELKEATEAVRAQSAKLAEADAALAAANAELVSITTQAAGGLHGGQAAAAAPNAAALSSQHVSLLETIVALVPREAFRDAVAKAGGNADQLESETANIISALRASSGGAAPAQPVAASEADGSGDMEADFDDDDFAQLEGIGFNLVQGSATDTQAERRAKAREFIKKALAECEAKIQTIRLVGKRGKGNP